jgi:hypothetical protein
MSALNRISPVRRAGALGCLLVGLCICLSCDRPPNDPFNSPDEVLASSDYMAVRAILDANGLQNIPVTSVISERGGRVNGLFLDSTLHIAEIPAAIGDLTALRFLQLQNNRLTSLPDEIGVLKIL